MRDRYKIANCHMFSTLYVGACDVLVTFDDACCNEHNAMSCRHEACHIPSPSCMVFFTGKPGYGH